MDAIYRLTADDLGDDFLVSLKALFSGKTIEIAVCEADEQSEDESADLLRDPGNRQRLMEAIENVRQYGTVQIGLDSTPVERSPRSAGITFI